MMMESSSASPSHTKLVFNASHISGLPPRAAARARAMLGHSSGAMTMAPTTTATLFSIRPMAATMVDKKTRSRKLLFSAVFFETLWYSSSRVAPPTLFFSVFILDVSLWQCGLNGQNDNAGVCIHAHAVLQAIHHCLSMGGVDEQTYHLTIPPSGELITHGSMAPCCLPIALMVSMWSR